MRKNAFNKHAFFCMVQYIHLCIAKTIVCSNFECSDVYSFKLMKLANTNFLQFNLLAMTSNRREFLRNVTLGTGALATGLPAFAGDEHSIANEMANVLLPTGFNMSGYAAPKIETVRIGFIGLGNRGPGAVERISHIEGVQIKALCDKRPERIEKRSENTVKKWFAESCRIYRGRRVEGIVRKQGY